MSQEATFAELGVYGATASDLDASGDSRNYQVEVLALERDTTVLLAHEGRSVALQRPGTWEEAPDGGQRLSGGPEALTDQKFFFQEVRGDARYFQDDRGERQEHDAVLVGVRTADVQAEDEFVLSGRRFRVTWVHDDRRYETRARCRRIA